MPQSLLLNGHYDACYISIEHTVEDACPCATSMPGTCLCITMRSKCDQATVAAMKITANCSKPLPGCLHTVAAEACSSPSTPSCRCLVPQFYEVTYQFKTTITVFCLSVHLQADDVGTIGGEEVAQAALVLVLDVLHRGGQAVDVPAQQLHSGMGATGRRALPLPPGTSGAAARAHSRVRQLSAESNSSGR